MRGGNTKEKKKYRCSDERLDLNRAIKGNLMFTLELCGISVLYDKNLYYMKIIK